MAGNELENGRSGIQVISRAATILRALRDNQTGMSLGQIAEQVSLPRSTVQRIVGALQDERLVMSNAQGGQLRLGPEITALAQAAQYNIVEQCRLLLTEITEKTGETADLAVMRGAGMIFLDQVPGTQRLRAISAVGEVFPLTDTANGRACLAACAPERARKLALDEWERRGIDGDINAFETLLDEIRTSGLAHDVEEHTAGIAAIGIAFTDWSGDLHAVSVPVPASRYESAREKIEDALRSTSASLRKMIE